MSRPLWLILGILCVGLGAVGIVVPGLPTTVFFIVAAACFARSSPRLEQWVLDLPGVGKAVRDYRAGLGMPRKAKVYAIGSIVLFAGLAELLALESWLARVIVGAVAFAGIAFIAWKVPTRETVERT